MSLRGFLIIIGITDLLAWCAWGTVLFATSPESGFPILFVFYASLLLALLGLCAIIGFCIRVYVFKRDELVSLYVKRTFRQGFLLSLLLVVCLMLAHAGLLRSWVVLIVVAIIGFGEHLFLSGEHAARN